MSLFLFDDGYASKKGNIFIVVLRLTPNLEITSSLDKVYNRLKRYKCII
ncbi:MAG: hypothetical protein L6U99_00965 [Clostridium sp.]|nr:MAG: hypothetical protein L6U99_00965 [Clostridium sp.]